MFQKLGYGLSGVGAFLTTRLLMLQRVYEWQLLLPHDFGDIMGLGVSRYCQDIEFGDYSITEISTMKHGAFQRFYAGLPTIDVVTLTFLKSVDNSVSDYFYAWFNSMISEEGYYSPKSRYKRDIHAVLYDRTGVESARFKLMGAFPLSRIPRIRASWADENVLRVSVRLRVDDIEMSSFIGGVREGVTNILGPVEEQVKDLLG